jgi:hypothetical protein
MREIPSVPGLFMMTCYTGFEWMVRQPDENGRAVISVKTTDLVGNPSLDYPSTWISKKGQACFAKDLPPTKFLEEVTLLEESAQRNNVFPIQKPAIPLVENMEESQQARPKEQNKEKEAKGDDSSCTIL